MDKLVDAFPDKIKIAELVADELIHTLAMLSGRLLGNKLDAEVLALALYLVQEAVDDEVSTNLLFDLVSTAHSIEIH